MNTPSRAPLAPLSLGSVGDPKKGVNSAPLSEETNCCSLEDIPGPRPSLPLLGTGWQYFPWGRYNLFKLHEASVDKFLRYGPVVREEFQWRRPVVHLYNPEDFETVFRHQGRYPLRPISEFVKHYRLSNPHKYDTPGLANSEGEEWQRLRMALSPVLMKLKSMQGMLGGQNAICDDLVTLIRSLRDPDTFVISDLQDVIYRLALESIYMMSLDSRLGCLDPELQDDSDAYIMISAVKLMFEAYQELYYGLPLWKVYQTSSYRKLDQAESAIYESASKYIQQAIERLRSDSCLEDEQPSVLQTLLRTKGLTDKEILVTVIDFISGGIFTVTNSLCFLLYHLAKNPDVQETLRQELQQVAPDGDITSDRLTHLSYLKACVKETFRLTPTVPCIARILPDDIKVSGYHVPAGTPLFCNFMVTCKQPHQFPDPEAFHPERWLCESSKTSINPYSMLPFGFGSRMCVGRKFSELEMYTTAAKLVHNFILESTGQELELKQAFIIVPSNPISLIVKDL